MKAILIGLLIGGLTLPTLFAAPTNSMPQLAGIVHLPERQIAIVETVPARPGNDRQLILSEGQREGDVEVLQIDPEKRVVKISAGGTNLTENFNFENRSNQPGGIGSGIMLDRTDLDPVLKIYAALKCRTLLRSPRLPTTSFSLTVSTTNSAQTVLMLEQAFAEKGITTIPDGEKFVMVVPEFEATTVRPRSSEIKSAAAPGDQTKLIPPGAITFVGAPLTQVARIYAEFIGCKLESSPRSMLPDGKINFENLTPLSKEEFVYAMDTLFQWRGVKVIPVADGLARLVPLSDPPPARGK